MVDIFSSGNFLKTIPRQWISEASKKVFKGIVSGNNAAFEIVEAPEIMKEMNIDRISASSADKTDITMQLHDIQTGYNPICGFSIKSQMGNPPTLLNASAATNFVYQIENISDDDMNRLNNIDSRTKLLDRMAFIHKNHSISFLGVSNKTFRDNLTLIDSNMEIILSELLMDYFLGNPPSCEDLIERLENKNPLHYPRKGFYEIKFKHFLSSVALGLKPTVPWDGTDEANGGYVIIKQDGDVVAYHIYNRNAFEKYLLHNTKLEKGSTSRHEYGSIYKENGKYYLKLNLQVRFKN